MWLIAALLLLILFVIYVRAQYDPVMLDGRSWHVVRGFGDKKKAAGLLCATNKRLIAFMRHLRAKYAGRSDDKARIVGAILQNYDPDRLFEANPLVPGTSYTLNKGESMHICLRDKSDYSLVDPNVLMFVCLHEISHIGNYNGWGHSDRFWRIFKFILREAVAAGVYLPRDYERHPYVYCGLRIDYSPLYDAEL